MTRTSDANKAVMPLAAASANADPAAGELAIGFSRWVELDVPGIADPVRLAKKVAVELVKDGRATIVPATFNGTEGQTIDSRGIMTLTPAI